MGEGAAPPNAGGAAPPATPGAKELPFSAPAERNKAPILEVLAGVLPAHARVLEVASGTGQHAACFAPAHPGWDWQPSDIHPRALEGIAGRCADLPNVRPALVLDVLAPPAGDALGGPFDAVFCANMIHIAPWATCGGLMQLAARVLVPDGALVLYGPFIEDDVPASAGNLSFDADLRSRDPQWGLRRLGAVDAEAARAGLQRVQRHAMPANNLTVVFQRSRA
jgi:SAM-dependent methyltransferase